MLTGGKKGTRQREEETFTQRRTWGHEIASCCSKFKSRDQRIGWDGETTIEIKFALLRGWALGAERTIVAKRCFVCVGNATTITFWKCKFYCREIFLSLRRLLNRMEAPIPTRKSTCAECLNRVVADVWEKDVWDLQAKSGSSGSCPLFLHSFLGEIAVQNDLGKRLEVPDLLLPDIREQPIKIQKLGPAKTCGNGEQLQAQISNHLSETKETKNRPFLFLKRGSRVTKK